jgi:hypothetical protein
MSWRYVMAGKKPAKRNISTPAKEAVKQLPGKAILYYGSNLKFFECPTCARRVVKGIIWEEGSSSYCTRTCIPNKELETTH